MIQYQNNNITIFESALYRTTSTVINTSDCVIIVDPNWLPDEVKAIQEHVAQFEQPKYFIFTHSDYDHIIGYQAFEGAKVIASSAFINHPNKEKNLQKLKAFDDENYIKRDYEHAYPSVDIEIKEDGQQFQIGATTLTFYKAEGHTSDGIFVVVEPTNTWIVGDYLSDVEFPFIYQSANAYIETLKKVDDILKKHKIELLVPGHGSITHEIEEIKKRKAIAYQYIQQLKTAILLKKEFPLEELLKEYDFPIGLKRAHEDNLKVVTEELKD